MCVRVCVCPLPPTAPLPQRKLFLFGKIETWDTDLDAGDCIETAFKDWAADTAEAAAEAAAAAAGAAAGLSRAAFERCWYQLADLNTERIDASECAEWIRQVVGRLTQEVLLQEGAASSDSSSPGFGQESSQGPSQGSSQGSRQGSSQGSRRAWRSDAMLLEELQTAVGGEQHSSIPGWSGWSGWSGWREAHSRFLLGEFGVEYEAWERQLEAGRPGDSWAELARKEQAARGGGGGGGGGRGGGGGGGGGGGAAGGTAALPARTLTGGAVLPKGYSPARPTMLATPAGTAASPYGAKGGAKGGASSANDGSGDPLTGLVPATRAGAGGAAEGRVHGGAGGPAAASQRPHSRVVRTPKPSCAPFGSAERARWDSGGASLYPPTPPATTPASVSARSTPGGSPPGGSPPGAPPPPVEAGAGAPAGHQPHQASGGRGRRLEAQQRVVGGGFPTDTWTGGNGFLRAGGGGGAGGAGAALGADGSSLPVLVGPGTLAGRSASRGSVGGSRGGSRGGSSMAAVRWWRCGNGADGAAGRSVMHGSASDGRLGPGPGPGLGPGLGRLRSRGSQFVNEETTAGRLRAGMNVGHARLPSSSWHSRPPPEWGSPPHPHAHLPLDTGRHLHFHMLARPASLHQLLPPHEPAAQLHGTDARPTKLKTVRTRPPPEGGSPPPPEGGVRVGGPRGGSEGGVRVGGPQSWVECPSLCGAMPRGAVPQMLSWDAGLGRPSLAVPRGGRHLHRGGGGGLLGGAMPYG